SLVSVLYASCITPHLVCSSPSSSRVHPFSATGYARRTLFFIFTDPPPSEIYTLSLHDALPIWKRLHIYIRNIDRYCFRIITFHRSEEHTSELQSRFDLVCRLLLEKKKQEQSGHLNLTQSPQDQHNHVSYDSA